MDFPSQLLAAIHSAPVQLGLIMLGFKLIKLVESFVRLRLSRRYLVEFTKHGASEPEVKELVREPDQEGVPRSFGRVDATAHEAVGCYEVEA